MGNKGKQKALPRIQWMQGDEFNKWVTCLDCYSEYFIESHELSPCCPMCGSREYEESPEKDFLNYDELDDLL